MSDMSPAAGTPQTATKAYAATVLAFLTILISAWIADDNGTSGKEILGWVVTAVIGSGLTGGVTYQVKNKAKALVGRR